VETHRRGEENSDRVIDAANMPAIAIRAITFDLDDTLWPVEPAIMRAEQRAHQWLAARAPAVAARWPIERLRELRMSIYQRRAELRHDLLQIRRIAMADAFEQSGVGSAHAMETIEGALNVFMSARNEVEPYAEVLACLERLTRRYPIASLTNGNADLAKTGLGHLFHATVSAHGHSMLKPDPGLFHIACGKLGCLPHEVVHVGDDPDLDVRGARSAGLHAVWINRLSRPWPGEDVPVTVPDLAAFERWLENV
jgi:FMN hydrolase / 5-amino-6-(5-phospho-D-ribitylamino)uracil phosphatase